MALVVVDATSRNVLGIARHLGADPALTARRPGSTLKPLLVWTAARKGTLLQGRVHACSREFQDGYTCFDAHGAQTLELALTTSCNSYAFQLATELGLSAIADAYRGFGFGKKPGLLAREASGFIADPAWLTNNPDVRVSRPELLVATGHGPIEVTPLQLALAYATLLEEVRDPSIAVSRALRAELLAGLRGVVNSPFGTGQAAEVEGAVVGGKTGTAERGVFGAEVPGQNGWFVGVAPLDEPKVVASVLVLGGASGRSSAASIAADSLALGLALPRP